MNLNNIRVSEKKQKELLSKAEDVIDTVNNFKMRKIRKLIKYFLLFCFKGFQIQQKLFTTYS